MKFFYALPVVLALVSLSSSPVSSFAPRPAVFSSSLAREQKHSKSASINSRGSTRRHLSVDPHDLSVLLSNQVVQTSTNLLDSYSRLLVEHPITTKSVTASILACMGDAIAQFRSEQPTNFQYDWKRGAAFLAFGALYTGAFQHVWFDYLSRHINDWGDVIGIWGPERAPLPVDTVVGWDEWWRYFDILAQLENPPSDVAVAAAKVAINQFIMIPTVYMPLFFAMTGALAGLDINQSKARAQSLFVPLLKRNYSFWLPTQLIQFLVLPVQWQIPFQAVASMVWTVILSSIGSAAPSASPSQIVAYETQEVEGSGEDLVRITAVDAGPVNEITDEVRLEDVQNALVPDAVVDTVKGVLADGKVGAASGGLAAGLLMAAADEGAIGEVVGDLINAEVSVGVAVATAVGAGVGLLASTSAAGDENEGGDSTTEVAEEQLEEPVKDYSAEMKNASDFERNAMTFENERAHDENNDGVRVYKNQTVESSAEEILTTK